MHDWRTISSNIAVLRPFADFMPRYAQYIAEYCASPLSVTPNRDSISLMSAGSIPSSFHAPRIGEKLLRQFVADMIETAQEALRMDRTPKPYVVPESVREIWRKAEAEGALVQEQSHEIGRSAKMRQGRLL